MDSIANLDLRLTDLRAHFEAQLRIVRRAEECLQRCRSAQDAVAFDAAADAFRGQLAIVAENRKTIGTLLKLIVDTAESIGSPVEHVSLDAATEGFHRRDSHVILTSTGNAVDVGSPAGRVLFVYPPGPDRDLYVSALKEAGFQTTAEASVSDATAMVQTTKRFDVIVMELLPEPVAAWTFIEQRYADNSGVPLIILTSLIRPDRSNRERARALGCAAFVAKPCSLMQLVDVVSRVRRGSRGLEISMYTEVRTGEDH